MVIKILFTILLFCSFSDSKIETEDALCWLPDENYYSISYVECTPFKEGFGEEVFLTNVLGSGQSRLPIPSSLVLKSDWRLSAVAFEVKLSLDREMRQATKKMSQTMSKLDPQGAKASEKITRYQKQKGSKQSIPVCGKTYWAEEKQVKYMVFGIPDLSEEIRQLTLKNQIVQTSEVIDSLHIYSCSKGNVDDQEDHLFLLPTNQDVLLVANKCDDLEKMYKTGISYTLPLLDQYIGKVIKELKGNLGSGWRTQNYKYRYEAAADYFEKQGLTEESKVMEELIPNIKLLLYSTTFSPKTEQYCIETIEYFETSEKAEKELQRHSELMSRVKTGESQMQPSSDFRQVGNYLIKKQCRKLPQRKTEKK